MFEENYHFLVSYNDREAKENVIKSVSGFILYKFSQEILLQELQSFRKDLGITASSLGELSNISVQTIRNIENKKIVNISHHDFLELYSLFNENFVLKEKYENLIEKKLQEHLSHKPDNLFILKALELLENKDIFFKTIYPNMDQLPQFLKIIRVLCDGSLSDFSQLFESTKQGYQHYETKFFNLDTEKIITLFSYIFEKPKSFFDTNDGIILVNLLFFITYTAQPYSAREKNISSYLEKLRPLFSDYIKAKEAEVSNDLLSILADNIRENSRIGKFLHYALIQRLENPYFRVSIQKTFQNSMDTTN
ncbi:MAG: helix-turn-helix transcriptional regulator [Treponema sp.]|nr:helix-turn-helix transcriptional regulator [Treponema sp.]